MKKINVKFLGSGDAFGSGGRFQACIFIKSGETGFLFDCGASSLIAMKQFGVSTSEVDAILISHLHGDHFGGVPLFILESQLISRREKPLMIAGPSGFEKRILSSMEDLFPGSSQIKQRFEINYTELKDGISTRLGELSVTPFEVVHASGAPPLALRVEFAGKTLAYSGDTEWTDNLVKAASGADLFVCESYSFDRRMRFHLNYQDLINKREELGCQRIILTHMNEEMLGRLDELDLECAEDGLMIEL